MFVNFGVCSHAGHQNFIRVYGFVLNDCVHLALHDRDMIGF